MIDLWGRRYYGDMNQSEAGAPARGVFGSALRASIARAHVVNNPAPVAAPTYKFRNFFGAFVARPATAHTVVMRSGGYGGIVPLDQQPLLQKPDPWSDKTLGRP